MAFCRAMNMAAMAAVLCLLLAVVLLPLATAAPRRLNARATPLSCM